MRSMFRGDQAFEFNDTLLTKFKIMMADKDVIRLFNEYFSDTFETEVLLAFDERFSGKQWEETEWYLRFQIHGKKKRRWKEKALKDYEEKTDATPTELYRFYLEATDATRQLHRLGMVTTDAISVEEAVNGKINEIKKWEEGPAPLTAYPFIEDKSNRVMKRAIMDDVALELVYFLEKEWESNDYSVQPYKELRDYPVNTQIVFDNKVHRKELEFDGEITLEGEKLPYKDLGPDVNPVQMIVRNTKVIQEMTEKLGITDSIKDLDPYDREIISSVMGHRSESFAVNPTIMAPLREVMLDVFKSDNKKNNTNLIQRLINLTKMTFSQYDEETGNFRLFGIFDYIEFSGEDNMQVEIIINKAIHDAYINKQTLRIYREQMEQLEMPMHSFLLFIQKERISAYKLNRVRGEITVDTFRRNLRFKAKRKKEVRDEIIASLNVLIERNLLVMSYTHGTDLFLIDFVPMDNNEVRDIVNSGSEMEDGTFSKLLEDPKPLA